MDRPWNLKGVNDEPKLKKGVDKGITNDTRSEKGKTEDHRPPYRRPT